MKTLLIVTPIHFTCAQILLFSYHSYRSYDYIRYLRDNDRATCISTDRERLKKSFLNWTSNNYMIDNFIQQTQLKASQIGDIIEWIPFNKFINLKYLAKGGFGVVLKAVWVDGYICGIDGKDGQRKRKPRTEVCLKSLNNSAHVIDKFLKEVEIQHKYEQTSLITIYGITKDPNADNYMMVMHYAKQGSLRKTLNSKFGELTWINKLHNLHYIATGLYMVHKAGLIHKDFHSGNIVNENIVSSYITDFGLCKPVSQDFDSKEIYGVLPFTAPEVLRKKEYTQKSDIYSFGIIMTEVFTGYPPYHDIAHDEKLAIQICLGYRPEIKCKVPKLLLDLINKCLDDNPQNRPTAKELYNQYQQDIINKKTELYKQVKEIENLLENSSTRQLKYVRPNYQTHKQAIYTSRLLNFQNLQKSVSKPIEDIEVPDDY